MKFSLKGLLVVVAFSALLFSLPQLLDLLYFAQYNAVQRRMEAVKGLKIVDTWQHQDITLEDCGFTVESGGTAAHFVFWDSQNWRSLFHSVDGIRFSDQGKDRFISNEELQQAGVPVEGLTDILEDLPNVLEYCQQRAAAKATQRDAQVPGEKRVRWITMKTVP